MEKKKNGWLIAGILGTGFLISSAIFGGADAQPASVIQAPAVETRSAIDSTFTTEAVEEKAVVKEKTQPISTYGDDLSNDNYYTNVDGQSVHSPAYSEDDSVPAGASAVCRDGTYSFSQNRRGTCSRHGGVADWL